MDSKKLFRAELYNRPIICAKCGGLMIFKGVGEYQCEVCRNVEYDDYGKVRAYLEKNHGATTMMIAENTGVSQKDIRQMVKESRFEVTMDSKSFLVCEVCGKSVRSGRYCLECEKKVNTQLEEDHRKEVFRETKVQGFGMAKNAESGAKRFRTDK